MEKTLPSIEDYMTSLSNPGLIKAPELQGGHCEKVGTIMVRYSGGFCVVFPYRTGNKKVAIRCWHSSLEDMQNRVRLISEELERVQLPYFVGFKYIEQGLATNFGIQPIIVMDWVDGLPIKEFIGENLRNKDKLLKLAEDFKIMVVSLHSHNLSHGDLQHGNIMVKDDGSLILVDYDSMFVPALEGYPEQISGLQGYQHESRPKNKIVSPKADFFSELVIYISILAIAHMPELYDELCFEDSETMVFSAQDIQSKGRAPIFNKLNQVDSLRQPVARLIEFMHASSINELLPLEDAIISDKEKTLGGIFEKMKQKPVYIAPEPQDTSGIKQEILRKLANKPQIENNNEAKEEIKKSIIEQMKKPH